MIFSHFQEFWITFPWSGGSQNHGFAEQLFEAKPSNFWYAATLLKSRRDGVFGPLEPQE